MEIYLYGEWGTITHRSAGTQDAHVVCRQLGYDSRCEYKIISGVFICLYISSLYYYIDGYADVSRCCARFGEGSGPIRMNYLRCTGTEHKLVDCYYRHNTYGHNEDWSVTCANGKDYYLCGYIIHHVIQQYAACPVVRFMTVV